MFVLHQPFFPTCIPFAMLFYLVFYGHCALYMYVNFLLPRHIYLMPHFLHGGIALYSPLYPSVISPATSHCGRSPFLKYSVRGRRKELLPQADFPGRCWSSSTPHTFCRWRVSDPQIIKEDETHGSTFFFFPVPPSLFPHPSPPSA